MLRRHRSPRWARRRIPVLLLVPVLVTLVVGAGVVTAADRVLYPRTDMPARVDGIVVVAGADDDRYVYARSLAESGMADQILFSRPAGIEVGWPDLAALLDRDCAAGSVHARDGRTVVLGCFTPDPASTEGEAEAATRIARERGWRSLLVVTYWGHVSRVRQYFDQCFDGDVHVTDTPRPTPVSRKRAVLHETGGYVKAVIRPAC